MTQPTGVQPTLLGRLLLPKSTYRTGALRATFRVRWFIRLRWLAVAGGAVGYGVDRTVGDAPGRADTLLVVVAVLVVLNLVWQSWSRVIDRRVHAAEEHDTRATRAVLIVANAQMAVDLIVLTVLIRLFGGVISPLAMFYAFHVAIAALLLTPVNALLHAAWALVLYAGVVFGTCAGWLDEPPPLVNPSVESALAQSLGFVALVYGIVAAGLLGIWYLVTHVATALDEREHELRQTTDALIASHKAIDELQARRARFMRTAAHQLKSPLAGIQTLASLIADGIVTGDSLLATTGKIVRRCREAIEQVNELLTLARLKEEGPERHRTAATDLVNTVRELLEGFRGLAQAKGIDLQLEIENQAAPSVRVEPRDLKDCLGNLIDNAIKYSDNGKRVQIRLGLAHGGASVSVQDEGVGMDADTLQIVFDEFRRGNQALAMQISGSGLGLSIVREVLEHAGGRITLCSAPGEGTTFMVWLPLADGGGAATGNGAPRIEIGTTLANPGPPQLEEIAYAGSNRREN